MTETESMVERVAKAINAAGMAWLNENDPKRMSLSWADVPDEVFARAAIEAFRRLPGHIWTTLEQADAEAEWMDSAKAVRHLHDILIDKALDE